MKQKIMEILIMSLLECTSTTFCISSKNHDIIAIMISLSKAGLQIQIMFDIINVKFSLDRYVYMYPCLYFSFIFPDRSLTTLSTRNHFDK